MLILDDFGLTPLTEQTKRDLLEILDDRYDRRSTIVTSQLPVEQWHAFLADPTLADAILDRLVHNSYRLALKGDSMRKHTLNSKPALRARSRPLKAGFDSMTMHFSASYPVARHGRNDGPASARNGGPASPESAYCVQKNAGCAQARRVRF